MAQPVIPSFPDIKDGESLARIEQYLVKLQRQLKYQFSHIDESNLQDGAITEKKLSAPILREIKDAYGNISGFRQAANQIALAVSNGRIFKADTEAALLSQLLAANIPMTEGLIWFDTTENLIKRCSVVSPLTWETLQTGEMHISGIDIEPNRVRIYSTSELLLEGATADLDTAYFRVHDGEKEIISATSEGVVVGADSIVANKYIGPVVGTHPGIVANEYGSIQTYINNLPKYLSAPVEIYSPTGTFYEDIMIEGFIGDQLRINIGSTIYGHITVRNCSNVYLYGVSYATPGKIYATRAANAITVDNVGIFRLSLLEIAGAPTHSCISIISSRAFLDYPDVRNAQNGVVFDMGSMGHCNEVTGSVSAYGILALGGSHISIASKTPVGGTGNTYVSNSTLLGTGTGTPTRFGAAPSGGDTAVYGSTACGRLTIPSSGGFSNFSSYSPRQGSISAEDYWGIWILPAITDYASATQAKVTVTRGLAQGSSGAVTVNIRGHGQTGIPGGYYTPTTANGLFTDYGMTVSLERGASATILLPTAALNALKAGTLKGFGLTSYGNLAQMADSISLEVTT